MNKAQCNQRVGRAQSRGRTPLAAVVYLVGVTALLVLQLQVARQALAVYMFPYDPSKPLEFAQEKLKVDRLLTAEYPQVGSVLRSSDGAMGTGTILATTLVR